LFPAERDNRQAPDPRCRRGADPFTGVRIVLNDQFVTGGGTSHPHRSGPGLTAVMNQWLLVHGGQ
jgi:kumamolisin